MPDLTRRRQTTPRNTTRLAMHYSVLDGTFAVPYITITSGVILTGFLLVLGATEVQIGLVAMFPLLSGLLQPIGVELLQRTGGWRRPFVIAAVITDTTLWGVTLAMVAVLDTPAAIRAFIFIFAFQQVAASFIGASWTSWMTDLIPAPIRGRYFGRRNFICNAAGVVTAVLAGQFIDRVGGDELWAYMVLIGFAMVMRYASAYFLYRQPEPRPAVGASGRFLGRLKQPLQNRNFRMFLYFSMVWGFSVNLSAPFFTVYMVRTLDVDFSIVALFAACATAANLAGQRFWGPLCDKYGNHQVMMATGFVIVLQPFWWLFTAAEGFGFYFMAFLSISGAFAWSGQLMAAMNLMMRIAPEIGRTSFFAVQAALGGAAGALGPFVGGLLAQYLVAAPGLVLGFLPAGLKTLFLVSAAIRFVAWFGFLRRVDEPVRKPKLNAVVLIRDTARTFNIQQGFSPLLHIFTGSRDTYRPQFDEPEVPDRRPEENPPKKP